MKTKELGVGNTFVFNSSVIPNNIFVLKHKDLDVGMVRINLNS